MRAGELKLPEFIFCEVPIKDGGINDDRQWLYCPKALSLVEIVVEDEMVVALNRDLFQQKFKHINPEGVIETFTLAVVQNNLEMTEIDPVFFLAKAWEYYSKYLEWEDSNLGF
jgi:hypothetical protein